MSKFRKIVDKCSYKGLLDGSLVRSTRRSVQDKNIHQIIVRNNNFDSTPQINGTEYTHASNGFLIGIINYLPGEPSIHTNHAVSAILTNGRLYCFNAHGSDSQPMLWLVNFLISRGLQVTDFVQYTGPNLQVLDTKGACTAFSTRFLKLHPNASMDQQSFNDYVLRSFFSQYTLPELYMYLENVSSIRNTGVSNNNRNNRNNNSNQAVNMNTSNGSRRYLRVRRQVNRMNVN